MSDYLIIKKLLSALGDPQTLCELSLKDWDRLLPLARRFGMLGRFYPQLLERGLLPALPDAVIPHLEASAYMADQHTQRVRWEINRIERTLRGVAGPLVLLKGAAYIAADLRCARGRLTSDVDVLVARDRLAAVERTLLASNWISLVDDAYDQHYYRRWAHELPPLRHILRGTVIDVHHTIVPLTSRLRPDPELLLASAEPLPGTTLRRLAPVDTLLHSAVHAFYDGDFSQIIRDLLDIHELLEEFSADRNFWHALPDRAQQLGLQRPLFYALRYSRRYLHSAVDDAALARLGAPTAPTLAAMDRLTQRAVFSPRPNSAAHWLLYARSHWLRMPPLLLSRHLLQKSLRRLSGRMKMDEHQV